MISIPGFGFAATVRSQNGGLAVFRVEVQVVEHGVRLKAVWRRARRKLDGAGVGRHHIVVEALRRRLARQGRLEGELLLRVHQ